MELKDEVAIALGQCFFPGMINHSTVLSYIILDMVYGTWYVVSVVYCISY